MSICFCQTKSIGKPLLLLQWCRWRQLKNLKAMQPVFTLMSLTSAFFSAEAAEKRCLPCPWAAPWECSDYKNTNTHIYTFTQHIIHTKNLLTEISCETGDWQGLAIKEWAAIQGVTLDTSQPASKATKWLVLHLLRRRQQPLCVECKTWSITCMRCQECSHPYCSACLQLEPNYCWDIDFCCPPCVVAGLITLSWNTLLSYLKAQDYTKRDHQDLSRTLHDQLDPDYKLDPNGFRPTSKHQGIHWKTYL